MESIIKILINNRQSDCFFSQKVYDSVLYILTKKGAFYGVYY